MNTNTTPTPASASSPTEKRIKLPSGELVSIKLKPAPERNTKNFVIDKVKFHIRLSDLKKNLEKDIWPVTEVLEQKTFSNTIPECMLWNGKKEDWTELLKKNRECLQSRRIEQLKKIRACQSALEKLNKEDWEAIKKIFSIQKLFSA